MVTIEITSDRVQSRTVTGRKDGKQYTFITQEGRIALNGELRRLEVQLRPEQAPYALGKYTIGDATFAVNQYASLYMRDLALVPLPK